ncbi:AmmeMemoRadiSam system protein A [bacterium]|nr:AmmeMemoRadiSam system protein A [bacterium]
MDLTAVDKTILLKVARSAVESAVTDTTLSNLDTRFDYSPSLKMNAGAFVTLEKYHRLRGCVGMIEGERELYWTVNEAAVSAALHDSRFNPVQRDEIKDLFIEISVLSPLEVIKNPNDVVVGKHGLLIISGRHHGLLLPQVAIEHRWDRNTFLEQTCVKAYLPKDAWQWKETTIQVFTANVFDESILQN